MSLVARGYYYVLLRNNGSKTYSSIHTVIHANIDPLNGTHYAEAYLHVFILSQNIEK